MSDPREKRPLPRPVDVESALSEALDLLSTLGSEHALVGGVALGFYGVERFTKDVDLAVSLTTSGRAEQLVDRDVRMLHIGGVSIATSSGVRVDLIDRRLDYRSLYEEAIREARVRGPIATIGDRGQSVPVVPPSYLIAMKLAADRPQDEIDIQRLLERPEIDYAATREIVRHHLGPFAAGRLDKMARVAGRADVPKDYSRDPS